MCQECCAKVAAAEYWRVVVGDPAASTADTGDTNYPNTDAHYTATNGESNFKNNISNAFEMVEDVPEFYGIGTGDKSVEEVAKEGDLGAYSGLSIASTLIYENVFYDLISILFTIDLSDSLKN